MKIHLLIILFFCFNYARGQNINETYKELIVGKWYVAVSFDSVSSNQRDKNHYRTFFENGRTTHGSSSFAYKGIANYELADSILFLNYQHKMKHAFIINKLNKDSLIFTPIQSYNYLEENSNPDPWIHFRKP